MTDLKLKRWLGPLGLLSAVLVFVGLGPLSGNMPGEDASGVTVVHYLNAHMAQAWTSIYLVGAGLVLLTVFLVTVHSVLRMSDQKVLPNAMFAAALIFIMGFVASGIFQVILITSAHTREYAVAHVANFASDNAELGMVVGLAMLTLVTGLCILTDRRQLKLPRTLGWYSILVAVVACTGPMAGLDFVFGLPIWVIATGFVISTKTRRGTLVPAGDVTASVVAPAKQPVAV
jgi:riboflavin transporter FmnP